MSTLSQFGGGSATRQVVNAFSGGGVSVPNLAASSATNMGKEFLSGALTAGAWTAVPGLSFTGAGQAALLAAYAKDTTSRTVGLRVTVDGVVAFTATTNAVTANGSGLVAAGKADSVAFGSSVPIRWSASLLVEVKSSLSETDKIAVVAAIN